MQESLEKEPINEHPQSEENLENQLPIDENVVDNSINAIHELEEQKEKYIRLLAEFENYKRRTAKERIEFFKVAGQDLIKDLLPALDDIERADQVIQESKDLEATKQGLQLISEKVKHILSSKGLKEIDCKEKDFDVDFMESITEIPAPTDQLKGKVIEVVQKGYTLNEKIIRYAKVIVGK